MQPCDRGLFCELYGDPETMRYIGRPLSRVESNASFRATLNAMRAPCDMLFFTVLKKRGGLPIGLCSIRSISVRKRSAEVGIMLVRSVRGHGYALESRRAFIDAAFEALPIDTIWVQNHQSNLDVARLNAKLGFIEASDWRPRGVRRGCCVRVLRRSDWSHVSINLRRGAKTT